VRQPTVGRGDNPRGGLGCLQQREYLTPAFLEEAALLGEGDGFVELGTGAEMITEFVIICRSADRRGSGTSDSREWYGGAVRWF